MFVPMEEENTSDISQEKDIVPLEDTQEADDVFQIEQLFGSRTRARLLGLFLLHADQSFYVREVARRVDAQLHAVRRELKNLLDVGILSEDEKGGPGGVSGQPEGEEESRAENKKFYRANTEFPLFEELRAVMNKIGLLLHQTFVASLQKKGQTALVVLTGRFVEAPHIPTDLLLVGRWEKDDLRTMIMEFEHDIGREISYTVFTPEEFTYRKNVGDRFLASIFQGKRVILFDLLSV